jgi:hypothetical protein
MSPLAKAWNSGDQVCVSKAVELQPTKKTPERCGGYATGRSAACAAIGTEKRANVRGSDTRPANRLGTEHRVNELTGVPTTIEPSRRGQSRNVPKVCIKLRYDSSDVGRERGLLERDEPPLTKMANQEPQGCVAIGSWPPVLCAARESASINVGDGRDGSPPSPERAEENLSLTNIPLNGSSTMAAAMKEHKKCFECSEVGTGAKPGADASAEIRFDHW